MSKRLHSKRQWYALQCGLLLLAGLSVLGALNIGPAAVQLWNIDSLTEQLIVWETRLPRSLLALCVGMALGSAGSAYQALLRNPLADPYILGVSGGAALGAAFGMWMQWPILAIIICAFLTSAAVMTGILTLAGRRAEHYTHRLLLTGVVFNAFAFACILMIHVLAPADKSQAMLLLLMGNLSFADHSLVIPVACITALGYAALLRYAPALDALSLGDDTAASLGIAHRALQLRVFCLGSLLVGTAVAVSGLIGFVGLFIPHAMRMLVGTAHRNVLPASAWGGGVFLVWADAASRQVLSTQHYFTELPVGVITALIGAPTFVWLLRRHTR